jgi:hypothetical protein
LIDGLCWKKRVSCRVGRVGAGGEVRDGDLGEAGRKEDLSKEDIG